MNIRKAICGVIGHSWRVRYLADQKGSVAVSVECKVCKQSQSSGWRMIGTELAKGWMEERGVTSCSHCGLSHSSLWANRNGTGDTFIM